MSGTPLAPANYAEQLPPTPQSRVQTPQPARRRDAKKAAAHPPAPVAAQAPPVAPAAAAPTPPVHHSAPTHRGAHGQQAQYTNPAAQQPTPAPVQPTPTPVQPTPAPAATPAHQALRVQGRRRQSPLLLVVALLLVLGSAGVFGALYLTAGNRTDVVVAANDIPQGTTITAAHLTRAEVAGGGFKYLLFAKRNTIIGSVANTTIAAGSIVSPAHFEKTPTIEDGFLATGLSLKAGQFPQELVAGRHVRVLDTRPVAVAGQSTLIVDRARVVSVNAESNSVLVTLSLSPDQADKVAGLGKDITLAMHAVQDTNQ